MAPDFFYGTKTNELIRTKQIKINTAKLVYASYRYLKKSYFIFVSIIRESLLDRMLFWNKCKNNGINITVKNRILELGHLEVFESKLLDYDR